MFIDESSSYLGLTLEYGRAARGERVEDIAPKGKKQRVSCISAIGLDASQSMGAQSLVLEDNVNQHAFLGYLEHILLPTLNKGTILVMDNWTIHHGHEVRDLVEIFGCQLLYLPSYSPDLNPIEHLFSKVKTFIKKIRPDNIDDLIQTFCDAINSITFDNILNSFKHCGYHF